MTEKKTASGGGTKKSAPAKKDPEPSVPERKTTRTAASAGGRSGGAAAKPVPPARRAVPVEKPVPPAKKAVPAAGKQSEGTVKSAKKAAPAAAKVKPVRDYAKTSAAASPVNLSFDTEGPIWSDDRKKKTVYEEVPREPAKPKPARKRPAPKAEPVPPAKKAAKKAAPAPAPAEDAFAGQWAGQAQEPQPEGPDIFAGQWAGQTQEPQPEAPDIFAGQWAAQTAQPEEGPVQLTPFEYAGPAADTPAAGEHPPFHEIAEPVPLAEIPAEEQIPLSPIEEAPVAPPAEKAAPAEEKKAESPKETKRHRSEKAAEAEELPAAHVRELEELPETPAEEPEEIAAAPAAEEKAAPAKREAKDSGAKKQDAEKASGPKDKNGKSGENGKRDKAKSEDKAEDGKSSGDHKKDEKASGKDKNGKKKEAEKTAGDEEAPEENEEKSGKGKKKKGKKPKVHRSRFFSFIKILLTLLIVLWTAAGLFGYFQYVSDILTKFSPDKLLPLIPLAAQALLALVSLMAIVASERTPAVVHVKQETAPKETRKESKQAAKEAAAIADDEVFLKPEVKIPLRTLSDPSSYQLEGVYKKNIEEINGKYYMQVAKFDDSVRAYDSQGATEMELCAVSMAGSAKFNEMLNQARTKTLSSNDFVRYFLSKPNTFVIKKRGPLDWTFKYGSKSYGIIREGEDSYKVSVKCYPDAAIRLNEVYMALEGSNFPSGPLWYCFNELCNLPPNVCKWLVDTSCQIARFQQIKVDRQNEAADKRPPRVGIDLEDLVSRFKAGARFAVYPKFAVVFSKGSEADYTTWLTQETEGLDVTNYTKDYYFKFNGGKNAASVLCPTKGVSEDVVLSVFEAFSRK